MRPRVLTSILIGALMLLPVLSPSQQRKRPPEFQHYRAALRIDDYQERIRALEKIKADYPQSQLLSAIDSAIVHARIGLCETLKPVLDLQKPLIAQQSQVGRVSIYYSLSREILQHPHLDRFDKRQVTEAIENYIQAGIALSRDQEFTQSLPERQRSYITYYRSLLFQSLAAAYLHANRAEDSLEALNHYRENDGAENKAFHYLLGRTHDMMDKPAEAYAHFFLAAVENYQDASTRARELYIRINGREEGFQENLESKQRELPYHPEPFRPNADDWQGKVVLAELFTGSECPPCVAADLGFDGLIDACQPQHVAILEYHLHIPRPDPLTNHATVKRAAFYGARSTPTTLFDGENKHSGGGDRSRGETKFGQYAQEIAARITEKPEIKLAVKASQEGETIKVEFAADKMLNGADYNLALVQKEEKYAGSNGIVFHKRVVREFLTVAPGEGQVNIDISESEQAAARHLSEYEKENNFSFPEKHFRIDRNRLQVVFFVQNRESKKVYNAVTCDVE